MAKHSKSRSPSAAVAKAVIKNKKAKQGLRNKALEVEAANRKKGGYGKGGCSIWEAPAGGLKNSPAYRKMVSRCKCDAKGKPPTPEKRDGAPIKGGLPLDKYPPNLVVDGLRASWLPDNFAQVIKNSGPGGVYHGWVSEAGKFHYHRNGYPGSLEETLGRKCTVMDGLNGVMRAVRNLVPPGADKQFHAECLTAKERKLIAPASEFHFGVVSARRATCESGQHDIMVIEGHFKQVGIQPVWYVDEGSLQDYKKLGLNAKVGGKLTPARNMILDDAKARRKVAVEISDDISKWLYLDCEKQDFRGQIGFEKANKALVGTRKHCVSPLAAAQFMLAKMRADPDKPHLGGVFPTANQAMTLGSSEFGKHHFILGDFFVAELSPCRFDCSMTLKEDYDYTCSHIKTHGCVLRCNRMFLVVKHATNAGGAVSNRDTAGLKEKLNIDILQKKWPGVFRINTRRKGVAGTEVCMNWNGHGKVADKAKAKVTTKVQKFGVKKVLNLSMKATSIFKANALVKYTKKASKADYIDKRCSKLHLKKVGDVIGMKFQDSNGNEKVYNAMDLAYDVKGGRLQVGGA